jgi:membrane protease YdiL (CAAX protease family)
LGKLLKFVRSVLAADLMQLIFLAGLVCLVVAPHLRWWPVDLESVTFLDKETQAAWEHFLFFAQLPIILAYAGGIFACLWPGRHPLRRVIFFVLLPALAGISVISGRFLTLHLQHSVFQDYNTDVLSRFVTDRLTLWSLGPGFQISVCGIALILFYLSRMAFNIATLPLSVPHAAEIIDDITPWSRTCLLIWLSVIPSKVFIYFAVRGVTLGIESLASHAVVRAMSSPEYVVAALITGLAPVAISILIFGATGWRITGRALRWCQPGYLALALLFPFANNAALSAGQYIYDYIYWGAHEYGRIPPPFVGSYFEWQPHIVWLLVSYFLPALIEEIIFRALLQPRLVNRYGILRGLFFVNIVWAAFHFSSDFNPSYTNAGVLLGLAGRMVFCLALGFVLGWLTLRSKSIWPSTICHFTHNALISAPLGYLFAGRSMLQTALWAILACILFRYWPVRAEEVARELPPQMAVPSPS